ncbi:MAG: hypothetical protein ACPIOQ_13095 [Promethearchaeia archaeon]
MFAKKGTAQSTEDPRTCFENSPDSRVAGYCSALPAAPITSAVSLPSLSRERRMVEQVHAGAREPEKKEHAQGIQAWRNG